MAQDPYWIDEKSLEIRAAEFTTSDSGDAPMLPELLDQTPPEQEIASVTADGAFDTRKCHDTIAARGPAAIIPPRNNAKSWKPDSPGALARNEITSKRVGGRSGDDGAAITAEAAQRRGGLVAEDATLDAESFRQIVMPNADGFIPDPRPDGL